MLKLSSFLLSCLLSILFHYHPTRANALERGAPLDPNRPAPRYIGSCGERNLCCSGRDSSCRSMASTNALQMQSSGLIGNLIVSEMHFDGQLVKECYCDSACMTLGDCCNDYKQTCAVQDCVVSDWDQWSECNVTCGVGTMTRTRQIISPAQNGGKECPDLSQKRACHGQHCKVKDDEKMLREMAIILQSSFSVTRNVDENKDIRRNLRLNYPKDPLKENVNEYCVLFEITKSHKSCETLSPDLLAKLQETSKVCVHCQEAAMRRHLGYRCYGHGTKGRSTRWSMFNFSGCHGRWIRLQEEPVIDGRCQCSHQIDTSNRTAMNVDADFIFV